jgi:hypothetical protein
VTNCSASEKNNETVIFVSFVLVLQGSVSLISLALIRLLIRTARSKWISLMSYSCAICQKTAEPILLSASVLHVTHLGAIHIVYSQLSVAVKQVIFDLTWACDNLI